MRDTIEIHASDSKVWDIREAYLAQPAIKEYRHRVEELKASLALPIGSSLGQRLITMPNGQDRSRKISAAEHIALSEREVVVAEAAVQEYVDTASGISYAGEKPGLVTPNPMPEPSNFRDRPA